MSRFVSAIADVFKALRAKLVSTGATVGGTADYPRIEIHSVVESSPLTKDDSLRSVTASIECISDEKVADIVTLLDTCTEQIFDKAGLAIADWDVIGIVPGQIRMFDEESSQDASKVIYRLLQDVTVWVDRKPEEESVEADTSETEVES
jgi:hypothetical protein